MVAAAAPGDAVSGQALAWRAVLREAGVEGGIYAQHVHPQMAGEVETLDRLPRDPADARLLRYSIWSDAAERAVDHPRERVALLYHNITPGRLLAAWSPGLADLCDTGRERLPSLADRVATTLADSQYNAAELRAHGFPEPTVVPLLLDLQAPPPSRERVDPVVLFVGRVVPSKRLEDAVRAVAILRRHLSPAARLDIVGSADGFEGYRDALAGFAGRLGARDGVRLLGRVSAAERDRAYAESGAYLSMSAHEGFCAPLLEALAKGLTVVARGAGAVPETLAGAGLVLPDDDPDPALAAEALYRVLEDAGLRRALAERARARLAEVSPERTVRRILAALAPLLGTPGER